MHESNETRVVSHVDDPLVYHARKILDADHKVGSDQERRSTQPGLLLEYLGFEYRSVPEAERRGFTVKPTDKYVDECLDIVQLQNAKAVMTPLTEQKSLTSTR